MTQYKIIGIKETITSKLEILEDNISCIKKAKYLLNEYRKNLGTRWNIYIRIKNNPFVLRKN
jgi:mevalonate pyrophosphate decarboxylase